MSLPRPQPQDWEENEGGDEASQESRLAKRARCPGCCDDKQNELLEEMRKMIQKQNETIPKIESMYQENRDLRGEISCLKADMSRLNGYLQTSPAPRILFNQNCSIPFQLKFLNSCKNDKYTTRKIQADDETPLKVAICNHNKEIIEYEPFSSMKVKVVPIHSDCDNDHEGQLSEEYFRSKIVTGRPGKQPLLYGDLYIKLQDGVGYLNSAKFQDNSSFVASRRFKLGVMAADQRISQRIQEEITEAFVVKDVRGYSTKKILRPQGCLKLVSSSAATKKILRPSPRDPVYKLSRIAPNGDRHNLLEQKGIKTVGDFYCYYMKSPEDLRKIMEKFSDNEWDIITNHALTCNPRPEISSRFIEERNMHEHETFSRSDSSCYLQGSCSTMQPSPAPQEPLHVPVTQQQIYSTNNELPPSEPRDNMPFKSKFQSFLKPERGGIFFTVHSHSTGLLIEGIQCLTEEQVSGLGGDEFLSVVSSIDDNALEGSSLQQCRGWADCSTMPDGNALPHVHPSVHSGFEEISEYDLRSTLSGIEAELMREEADIRSSAHEAGSVSYCVGVSPASELGSSRRDTEPSPFGRPWPSTISAAVPTHRPAMFRRSEISAETAPGHCTVLESQPFIGLAACHGRESKRASFFHHQGEDTVEGAGDSHLHRKGSEEP